MHRSTSQSPIESCYNYGASWDDVEIGLVPQIVEEIEDTTLDGG
jgi:hypothetical protein